jgi:tripartite-type tricarboxylate transporter receptor subunit TctC
MKRRDLLAVAASAVAAPWVHAQAAWPTRGPIRLICQYPPGGLVDTVARLLAPHLSQALSQTVVVENRAGAGGLVGTEYAARQASVHIYATATRKSMPFDPVNDFTHMGMLVEAPMLLLVRAQSPYQTLAQYINAAKTKPVRYGTSGIGSANHLYGELLKIEGQANEHDHVPYQGSAPAMQDLMGGQIDSVFDPVTTNVNQLKAGSLRALAVSTPNRLPALPNIPTFAELGYNSLTGSQWLGLSAPKNLPAPIAQRITALIPEILAKPDIMARLEDVQTLPRKTPVVGDEFTKLIQSQINTWTAVAKRAKVEVIV